MEGFTGELKILRTCTTVESIASRIYEVDLATRPDLHHSPQCMMEDCFDMADRHGLVFISAECIYLAQHDHIHP